MCGRFTLTRESLDQLASELDATVERLAADYYRPRYNVAPTDPHLIMRIRYEDREVLPAKWGLVNSWARDAKRAALQINARSETVSELPPFRDAFRRRRCIVPTDGFFEWSGSKKARQPLWFHREDGGHCSSPAYTKAGSRRLASVSAPSQLSRRSRTR